MSSCFRDTTVLLSWIATVISPLASSELYGNTTFNPCTLEYHTEKHWECYVDVPVLLPFGPQNTMGQAISLALM